MTADYAALYDPDTDFDRWYTTLSARRIDGRLRSGSHILEVGAATGGLTRLLAGQGRRFVCVERAAAYVARARARGLPGVRVEHTTIEEFRTTDRFDHVLAVNVLHELPDWRASAAQLAALLRPGGHMHVTLPNPESLHRLAALGAGMIRDLREPSQRGRRFQTVGLLDADTVVSGMAAIGLRLLHREGVLVKPLPNDAMARLSPELIEAWDDLAQALPDHAAMTLFEFERTDG